MKKGHTLGFILILIGVFWIIRQTGIISVNWAASIKTVWPVFLVAAGASIILGSRKRITTGFWILAFAIFIGYGIMKRNEPMRIIDFDENLTIDVGPLVEVRKEDTETEIPLEQETENGRLILQLGSAVINLKEGNSDHLVSLDSNISGLKQRVSHGKTTTLEYSQEQGNSNIKPHFRLEMNPELKWDIEANLGVVDGTVDMSEIPAEQMVLRLGVGDLEIRLGDRQEKTNVTLWAGLTELDIYIPRNAGLKINQGKLMSDLNFHNIDMKEQDDYYISKNYDTAEQKIEIEIVSAMSNIEIFAE